MIIVKQRKKVIKLLVEFVGACGGKVAINPDEIVFICEKELLRVTLVNVKLKNGKSFLLKEEFDDVLLKLRYAK